MDYYTLPGKTRTPEFSQMLLLHLLSLYTLIPPEPLPQWEDYRLLNAVLAASTIVFENCILHSSRTL